MRFTEWLTNQIVLAEENIADFDRLSAAIIHDGGAIAIWRAEYVAHLAKLRDALTLQIAQDVDHGRPSGHASTHQFRRDFDESDLSKLLPATAEMTTGFSSI